MSCAPQLCANIRYGLYTMDVAMTVLVALVAFSQSIPSMLEPSNDVIAIAKGPIALI